MMYLHVYKSIQKQKLTFAGHVLHGSSGECILQILERKMNSKAAQTDVVGSCNALDQAE